MRSEDLRIVRSARDGYVRHAVPEQVFRAQLRVYMHQHSLGSLPLAGMAGHGIAMIEMRMPGWVQLTGVIVHPVHLSGRCTPELRIGQTTFGL